LSAGWRPGRWPAPTNGCVIMSASGPAASMPSNSCCAGMTCARPNPANKETRNDPTRHSPRPPAYGTLGEDATLTLERLLPGSIDRVWAFLTESDLRRQWLAAGTMEMRVGAPVELVWRNSELMENAGERPEGF